jgi:large subunit ribosomal protein L25
MEETMQDIKLKGSIREASGTKIAHKIRAQGEVPGVLYGHKEEPIHLSLPEHELWHILHHATSEHLILTLEIEGVKDKEVLTLVRDVQHHPVTGDILHVDFQRISLNEKIKVGVPVMLNGIARGVKEFGGILDHGVREVTIHCTPKQIPEAIEVDVTDMVIGNSIHIIDIAGQYPELEFLDDSNVTLAHVSPPKKLEIFKEEVEAAEGEAAAEEEAEAAAQEGETAGEGEES